MNTSQGFAYARQLLIAVMAVGVSLLSLPSTLRAAPMENRPVAGGRVLGLGAICDDCTLKEFAHCDGLLEGPSAAPDGSVWLTSPSLGRIYKLTESGKCELVVDNPIPHFRPAGTKFYKDGLLYGAIVAGDKLYTLNTKTRKVTLLDAKPIADDQPSSVAAPGDGYSGFNDFALDATGGAYITDMRRSSVLRPNGRILYRAPDGEMRVLVPTGLALPDGIVLSPDGKTLYFNEWLANRLIAVPVVSPGVLKVGLASVFAYLGGTKGPDGMGVDAAGNIYVAHQGAGGEIAVFAPDGSYYGAIRLAKGRDFSPTHLTFQGDYLYVTEGKEGDPGKQPNNNVWRMRIKTGALKRSGSK